MKSILVIGLGRFGRHLSLKLMELGNEVMAIDEDEEAVEAVAPFVTASRIGNCQDVDVLKELGVNNFDICFVCISDDFQSSLEVTFSLKELGARYVIARADREAQTKFLHKIGADEVIHPEKEMAQRTAVKYSARNAFDYIELTPEYAIFEIRTPEAWLGKTVAEAEIRTKHNVNIIGIKTNDVITPMVRPEHIFTKEEHLIIAGLKKDMLRLTGIK
ncbi:MAG: TrkA family potassium uptake protein [Clostridiales bacterium]|nr:TrkA family potassium uptake protein [Clostridiales bacterium]